ncbi:MAG: hypothetical protein R3B99_07755 [Polyangiales bacterium]
MRASRNTGAAGATSKQIENAFRLQWGYNAVPRRQMSVISRRTSLPRRRGVGRADCATRLDAGRPVLYMALQADDDMRHAFVIDGCETGSST